MVCAIVLKRYSINNFTERLNYSGLCVNIVPLEVFFSSGTIRGKKKSPDWSKIKFSGFEYEKIFNQNIRVNMRQDIWPKKECISLSNTSDTFSHFKICQTSNKIISLKCWSTSVEMPKCAYWNTHSTVTLERNMEFSAVHSCKVFQVFALGAY